MHNKTFAFCLIQHGFLSAPFQRTLKEHAHHTLAKILKKDVSNPHITVETTPFHTLLHIENLPTVRLVKPKNIQGPLIEEGDAALAHFLAKFNITKEALVIKQIPTGACYFWTPPVQESDFWPDVQYALFQALLAPFHKKMFWTEDKKFLWARPIHSHTTFWGSEPKTLPFPITIPFTTTIQGAPTNPLSFTLNKPEECTNNLAAINVTLCGAKRFQALTEAINASGFTTSCSQHSLENHALGSHNPHLLTGRIHHTFHALDPFILKHIIQTKMCAIPLYLEEKLTHFGVVVERHPDSYSPKTITSFENVCKAYLEDVLFFIDKDTQNNLEHFTDALKTRTIHHKLGSLYDHTQRLQQLLNAGYHCQQNPETLQKAITLMKCDLETLMVQEYADLQGYVGSLYAQKQGCNPEISQAIKEQYLPLGPNSPLPASSLGSACAFLDKVLTLVSFISVGRQPTSSKDPFGIRRLCLGIIRIAQHYPWTHNFLACIKTCLYVTGMQSEEESTLTFLKPFLIDRLTHHTQKLYHANIIQAAVHKAFQSSWDIHHALQLMDALHTHKEQEKIIQGYKRAKQLCSDTIPATTMAPSNTHDASFAKALASFQSHTNPYDALAELAKLAQAIQLFCDAVHVYTDCVKTRTLRQSLLHQACTHYQQLAHFDAFL